MVVVVLVVTVTVVVVTVVTVVVVTVEVDVVMVVDVVVLGLQSFGTLPATKTSIKSLSWSAAAHPASELKLRNWLPGTHWIGLQNGVN